MLVTFVENGRIEIDNNLCENAIRPTAVGKKNWLFIGAEDAGWRSAVIYTIITSCRSRGIDPYAYIKDVLSQLPTMTNHQIVGITPEPGRRRITERSRAARLDAYALNPPNRVSS